MKILKTFNHTFLSSLVFCAKLIWSFFNKLWNFNNLLTFFLKYSTFNSRTLQFWQLFINYFEQSGWKNKLFWIKYFFFVFCKFWEFQTQKKKKNENEMTDTNFWQFFNCKKWSLTCTLKNNMAGFFAILIRYPIL